MAGLTLIEVLAALAILGTVLVGVVMAKSRHTRQIAATQKQNTAVRAADELIAGWWASPDGIPVGQTGLAARDGSLVWLTQWAPNSQIEKLGARVVRIEIRQPARQDVASGGDQPLVAVEMVVPDPDRRKARSASSAPATSPATAPDAASVTPAGANRHGVISASDVLQKGRQP